MQVRSVDKASMNIKKQEKPIKPKKPPKKKQKKQGKVDIRV
jgi:hypothetical protein